MCATLPMQATSKKKAEKLAEAKEKAKEKAKKLNGKATVIYGESAAGTAGKEESDTSFANALKATAPGATVVAKWTISDRAKSQTDVGTVLQGNPTANAVAATNDEGTLGAIGAFKAAGKDLPCVVGFGGNDEVLGLVKDGTIGRIALGPQY